MPGRWPRLLVFAKAPMPGRVCRRLAPALGSRGAAVLHMRLTADALARLARPGEWATRLCAAPGVSDPFLGRLARRHRIPLRPQRGRDLGERMDHALAVALRTGAPAALVGTDLPTLGPGEVRSAFGALESGRQVVLLPTEDGGFGLIGLAGPLPGLLRDVPWGTGGVMAAMRRNLRELDADWAELAPGWDVDRPADLARLPGRIRLPGSP